MNENRPKIRIVRIEMEAIMQPLNPGISLWERSVAKILATDRG